MIRRLTTRDEYRLKRLKSEMREQFDLLATARSNMLSGKKDKERFDELVNEFNRLRVKQGMTPWRNPHLMILNGWWEDER
jgi:hypothetical protein